ncbi:lactate racemase domain-containing protein [Alkalibacter saccharofermentans]|uniref:Nickel-dependent lactate racemase n=1 Tax=Alkalibacter saccharofermentans DSM 14828 TaxID=1120975 RepID=A0A1M5A682_9FIRM|nr:lactate racemase domain-containing protein [Alkalibacter saccharofermentans]SHF25813.1 Nickel-dependent lactate racemase [Alkalibacter saccharofermentans DSM 14828]
MEIVNKLIEDIKIPKMAKVRQIFPRPIVEDVAGAVNIELSKDEIKERIKPGMKIAITGGSRGVANIAIILKEVASFIKEQGAEPFIIPAMGSHGGATAEGQTEVLESYGITEEFCGCQIKSTMETTHIGYTDEQHPVYIDKFAAEADGIVVVNRIKPHTCFRGTYESGLMKMITIGLGKQKGADVCHAAGFKHMARLVPLFANAILANSNILFGIATLENPFDETCKVLALTNEQIPAVEPNLLIEAKGMMAKILFDDIDVLIVDKIGKNYSGDGMDPNISGTFCTPYASGGVKAQRVAVLDLSDETHGNAVGMGSADLTTRRLFEKADLAKTYPNAITSTVVNNIKIPMILNSDRDVIKAAIKTCNEIDRENPLIVRIGNTLHVEYIYISEALLDKAKEMTNVEVISEAEEMEFDDKGNLW